MVALSERKLMYQTLECFFSRNKKGKEESITNIGFLPTVPCPSLTVNDYK